MPVCTDTTAGSCTATCSSRPPSSSRDTSSPAPSRSTATATPTNGSPSRPASAAPTAPLARSADWTPHSTRSGASPPATVASARAADSGSWVARSIRTPRSAPIASARCTTLSASSSPAVTASTSPRGLAQGERGLDGARVPLVQGVVEEVGIDGAAVVRELEVVGNRADLLDAHQRLHHAAVCIVTRPGGGRRRSARRPPARGRSARQISVTRGHRVANGQPVAAALAMPSGSGLRSARRRCRGSADGIALTSACVYGCCGRRATSTARDRARPRCRRTARPRRP